MKTGLIGMNALYYPPSQGDRLIKSKDANFTCAATLGVDRETIKACMRLYPEEYAEKYGVKIYEKMEDMIEAEKLDTLVISTRHSEHAYWAEKAAKCGIKKMYMPKTFATTVEDAEKMVNLEKQYNITIACGPSMRFLPQMQALKRAVTDGPAGKPHFMRFCHHHGTVDVFNKLDWYLDAKEGGPEFSLGWYGVDLAMFLMGEDIKSVYAKYDNFKYPWSPFMDCGRMEMLMGGGKVAQFDMYVCNNFKYPSWQIEIVCENGVAILHRVENDMNKTVAAFQNQDGYVPLELPTDTSDMEACWIDDFLNDRKPVVNAEYSAYVTKVCIKAKEANQKGHHIKI